MSPFQENKIVPAIAAKRILFVATGLEVGGAEVFLADLISQLLKAGLKCAVFSLKGRGPIANRLEDIGCQVIPIANSRIFPNIKLILQLRHIIKTWRPDIVQGWMYHGNLAASLSAMHTKNCVAWSVHHSLDDIRHEKQSIRILLRASRFISRQPRMIHYCSRIGAEQHSAFGFDQDRQKVIPNGIDCERFRPNPLARQRAYSLMGIDSSKVQRVVANIGRYHPMKDHKGFLEAASIVAGDRNDVCFVLIGEGVAEDNKEIASYRDSLGLKGRAIFLGRRDDISELFHGVDILSTSSAWGEAFPIVIGEAMATGIPCVATDVGDCDYLVGDTGIIVPPRNPSLLAAAWRDLLLESEQTHAIRKAKARERVVEHFDLQHIANRFIELYENLV